MELPEFLLRPWTVMGLEPVSHVLLNLGSDLTPKGVVGRVNMPEPPPQS